MTATILGLRDAAGQRLGIVPPAQVVAPTPADLAGIQNATVPLGPIDPRRSLGGGVGFGTAGAIDAAIGEALERYAAWCAIPVVSRAAVPSGERVVLLDDLSMFSTEQQGSAGFPHRETYARDEFAPAVDLGSGTRAWLPASVVSLDPARGTVATSNGLAAGPDLTTATLRAVEELVERDAFMATWLHQVGGREVALSPDLRLPVADRHGTVRAFDITPAYSSHPVALVAGSLPLGGIDRHSLGLACRSRWADALEKAYLEWAQGTTFVGHRRAGALGLQTPADVRSFDDHALYHSVQPGDWASLPLFRAVPAPPPADALPAEGRRAELVDLLDHLGGLGIELFRTELTTVDLHQVGVRVARCVSPQLTPIHGDHRWPHLGGTTPDLARRFPGATVHGPFPSPHPHPLG